MIRKYLPLLFAILTGMYSPLFAGEVNEGNERGIRIGWAKRNITPAGPVMLSGQQFNRLATGVRDPLFASALAMQTVDGHVVMISADLVSFDDDLLMAVRKRLRDYAPDLDPDMVFGSATHTHTAPQLGEIIPFADRHEKRRSKTGRSSVGNVGIDVDDMRRKYPNFVDSRQYFEFVVEQITALVAEAWERRAPGQVAWGYATAVIGHNRRWVFKDGRSRMYGIGADVHEFSHVEGHVDHGVNLFSTYDVHGELTGLLVNIAAPAQTSEADNEISADFWNEVREAFAKKYGADIYLLPQCAFAGDISPHTLLDARAEERMLRLKGFSDSSVKSWAWAERAHDMSYNIAKRREIASRIMNAISDALPWMSRDLRQAPLMLHRVVAIELEEWAVSREQADKYNRKAEELEAALPENAYNGAIPWMRSVVARHEQPFGHISTDVHVMRIDEIAFVTSRFEYYLDYGDRIKAKSPAAQTFLVQLAGDGSYLSTLRNIAGGSYGSVPASGVVSPEGGERLEHTILSELNEIYAYKDRKNLPCGSWPCPATPTPGISPPPP